MSSDNPNSTISSPSEKNDDIPSLVAFNTASQVPLKLTSANYVVWAFQIRTLLSGYDLHKFVDSSFPCPASTIDVEGKKVPNLLFSYWIRQDQLILSALIGSITPTLISFIASAATSAKAWGILATIYGQSSRGRILAIKNRIHNHIKGTKSITDFMLEIKGVVDELSLLGVQTDSEDLVLKVLNGLDDSYKDIGFAIQARDSSISFEELHEKLLSAEFKCPARAPTVRTNSGITFGPPRQPHHQGRNNQPSQFGPQNRTGYQGKCQICGVLGHSARRCPDLSSLVQAPVRRSNFSSPSAHTAISTPPSLGWILDSGASHHVTTDLANLSLHTPSSLVMVKDQQTGDIILQGLCINGLYIWLPTSASLPHALSTHSESTSLWHSRLGHPSPKILRHALSSFHLQLSNNSTFHCESCKCVQSHKLPFDESTLSSTRPLELLFSDVWTSHVMSFDGYKYYFIFVDHYTKYVWLYPLKRKSDVLPTFVAFKVLVENYHNTHIRTLYSDNGGEYLALQPFLTANGITHLTTPGNSEPRHRHVVDTGLALLHHASMPLKYWPYAFSTAAYLINRLPKVNLNMLSAFEKLYKEPPNISKLRIFGCTRYSWLRPYSTQKLDTRSTPCVFVGYSLTQSAYLCLDKSNNRLVMLPLLKLYSHFNTRPPLRPYLPTAKYHNLHSSHHYLLSPHLTRSQRCPHHLHHHLPRHLRQYHLLLLCQCLCLYWMMIRLALFHQLLLLVITWSPALTTIL